MSAEPAAAWVDNQALQRAAGSDLRINRDPALEREADHVAERVVEQRGAGRMSGANAGMQRKCASCDEGLVQAKPAEGGAPGGAAPRPHGAGRALAPETRRQMEAQFGHGFDAVRIHDGGDAGRATRQLRARAFTLGRDIYFAPGAYAPQSTDGARLLAHELTHVVQQSGGGAGISATATALQGDGGVTDADLAVIRAWMSDAGSPQPGGSIRLPFPGADRSLASDCPTCHSVSRGLERQAQERAAAEERRARNELWPGRVEERSVADLDTQGATLGEEIDQSRLAVIHARRALFDRVLESRSAAALPALVPDERVRDAWVGAAQTALVLEATLAAVPAGPGAELTDVLRAPFVQFFDVLAPLFDLVDVKRARLAARFAMPRGAACPGGCHAPAAPPRLGGPFDAAPAFRAPMTGGTPFTFGPLPTAAPVVDPAPSPGTGLLGRELTLARGRTAQLAGLAGWQRLLDDFHWAQRELDSLLRDGAASLPEAAEQTQALDYAEGLLERQRNLHAAHPDALRVRAVFYPRNDVVNEHDASGRTSERAHAIPWQFYVVPPTLDEYGQVRSGARWELHDVTAPRRAQHYVVADHKVSDVESFTRSRMPIDVNRLEPPRRLFEQLDHEDFFREGELRFRYPLSGTADAITMHGDTPIGTWLERIGMSIALIGGFIFAPYSTPFLVSVIGGTALAAAGRIHRFAEREAHGVAEEGEGGRLAFDLATDAISMMTLGLGRVVAGGLAAGTMARSSLAFRGWFLLRQAQVATGAIHIGLVTHDFVVQVQAIQASSMTPEQKDAAIAKLALVSLAAGGMTLAALRADVASLRRDSQLRVEPGPGGRLLAAVDDPAAAGAHGRALADSDAVVIRSRRVTAPDGEHTLSIHSDGSCTRCSDGPCPHPSDVAIDRLEDMLSRLSRNSPQRARVAALAAEAQRLRALAPELRTDATELDGALRAFARLDEQISGVERELLRGGHLLPPILPRTGDLDGIIRSGGPMPPGTRVIAGAVIEVPRYDGPTQLRAISGAQTDELVTGAATAVPHATTPAVRTPGSASSIGGAWTRREWFGSHINDAEVKLLAQIRQHLPPNAHGRIHFMAMRSRLGGADLGPIHVCSSCVNLMHIFRGDYPGVMLVDYSITFPAPTGPLP